MKFQTTPFRVTWAGGQANYTGESSSNAAQNLSEQINCAAAPSNICIIRIAWWERSVGCQQHNNNSTSHGLDQNNKKTKSKLNKLKYGRLANKPAAPLVKQQQAKRSKSRNETNQTATKAWMSFTGGKIQKEWPLFKEKNEELDTICPTLYTEMCNIPLNACRKITLSLFLDKTEPWYKDELLPLFTVD